MFVFLSACDQKPKSVSEQMKPASTISYLAIDGKDTAWLRMDTAHQRMIGLLSFSYGGKDKYEGEVKGIKKGDTLNGHFDFKVNGVDKWYRNPVTFLKKNDKLIMGVGKFTLIWGSAYFDPHVPVDYDRGRFVFEQENDE
ncbi:hypothetical protein D9M68_865910 [compost metagenome]